MQNKIRLFVDSHVFDDSLQGSRTYIKGLYNELIKSDLNIEFYFGAFDIENLENEFGKHENVRYIKYHTRNKFIRLAIDIPYNILKYRIDIAHFQYISPLFKFSKEILTIHDVLFLDFPDLFPAGYRLRNKVLFRGSARKADYLLTVSEYSRQRISEHFGIKTEDIHIIPNGISDDYFNYYRKLPDIKTKYGLNMYMLYVSRIEPRKNHVLLLKAFEELELWKKGYKLVLIGNKALASPLFESCFRQLPDIVSKSVLVIDGSYGDELKSFYRNCSLFIYPSLAEGFGIPPLEAVASQVPVLCANTTAMSDFSFLGNGLFNPQSISELKEKINLFLDDGKKDFRSESEYVRTRYNWRNSASAFVKIILKQ
jgi:glycosyltransferase involved in cell wall biosynthesis